MRRPDLIFILKSLITWRLALIVVVFFAVKFLPVQNDFLGGRMVNYLTNPGFWSLANFDGEHYLAIAREGYRPLTYFFFPLFPVLINFFSIIFGEAAFNMLLSGLFISHLSLFIGMVGLYKLVRLDYKENIFKYALILLLLFPTSFYFGSVYTESMFLALAIWTFYFARRGNFLTAGILAAFAGATRLVGVALIPVLIIELFIQKKNSLNFKNVLGVLISSLGITTYMIYLKAATGSFLEFFKSISVFGEQRGPTLILLPQVFYRYFVKILPNINYSYFPATLTIFLEIIVSVFFLILIIFSFKKLRFSYWIFLTLGYLIPTLSGSFSSLPRYVLVLFPAFIFLAVFFEKRRGLFFAFLSVSFILLLISFALFARGYWIS